MIGLFELLTLAILTLICGWALWDGARNRRTLREESRRLEWLERALKSHQSEPHAHGPPERADPWKHTRHSSSLGSPHAFN